jgi:hypothetical protein
MDRMAATGRVNHLPNARRTHEDDMEGVGEWEEEQEEDVD